MAENDNDKPVYTQPTTVTDLEERYRREEEGQQVEVVNPTPYAVEDNDVTMYAGVSEEYATYADDRQRPFAAEEGVEAEAEARIRGAEAGLTTVTPQPEQVFTKPEREVNSGVAPSAKAVGGLAEVGPQSLGATADEPVPVTVQPKFEDSDFASSEEDETPAVDVGDTPVAVTEGADTEADPQAQAGGGGTDTTEAEPAPAEPKKGRKAAQD